MTNRKNVTWITKDGERVPISNSRRRKDEFEDKFIMQHVGSGAQDGRWDVAIARIALSEVLKAPILNELYTAYILADSIYENWALINQVYEAYEKQDCVSMTALLKTQTAKVDLSDIQTDVTWAVINRCVPSALQEQGKQLLSQVMSKVTSGEISFVTAFLNKIE